VKKVQEEESEPSEEGELEEEQEEIDLYRDQRDQIFAKDADAEDMTNWTAE